MVAGGTNLNHLRVSKSLHTFTRSIGVRYGAGVLTAVNVTSDGQFALLTWSTSNEETRNGTDDAGHLAHDDSG